MFFTTPNKKSPCTSPLRVMVQGDYHFTLTLR
nr:MAG TPA: hypothetical protein [Caudoviricetes sp.]